MSKFTIANTNVSLKGTLKDGGAFAGSSGTSLNTYGSSNRWPRVVANISINSHFRNRDFVRFVTISTLASDGGALGEVEVTSPFSEGPAQSVSLGVTYVFDTSAQTTITVEATTVSGFVFTQWQDHLGNVLSYSNPATLTLTNATVGAATSIQGIYFPTGGPSS